MMQYPVVTLPNANKEGFMTWMCICENPSLQLVDIWFVHAVINMLSPTYLPLFQSIISDQVVLINVKLGLIIPAVLINHHFGNPFFLSKILPHRNLLVYPTRSAGKKKRAKMAAGN